MSESNVNVQTEGLIEVVNEIEQQDVSGAEEVLNGKEPEKVEAKPEEKKIESKLASKFAALSKKEKAIKQREKDLERRIKELESKSTPQSETPKIEETESFELALKRDPLKALAAKGLDFETLAKLALNDGKLTPDMQMQLMREEIENNYKKEISEIKKQLEDKQKKEEEQSIKQQIDGAKKTVFEFIDGAGDEFELIRTNEAHQAVWDLIEKHFDETSELLDIKEAAEHIENQLLKNAEKHLNLNKIKKLLESKSPKKPSEETVKKPASQTLTNSLSQAGQGASDRQNLLSQEDSLAQAAKLLKWSEG